MRETRFAAVMSLVGAVGCTETTVRCVDGAVPIDGSTSPLQCMAPLSTTDAPGDRIDSNGDGVDGMLNQSVYVSGVGSDTNTGLTPMSPVRTLARAFAVGASQNPVRTVILMQAGEFRSEMSAGGDSGATVAGPVIMRDGYSLYGQYAADWVRATTGAGATTVITGPALGLWIYEPTRPVVLQDLEIVGAPNPEINMGQSGYGLRITHATASVVVRNCHITAPRGEAGVNGQPGTAPADTAMPGQAATDMALGRGGMGCVSDVGRGGNGGDGALSVLVSGMGANGESAMNAVGSTAVTGGNGGMSTATGGVMGGTGNRGDNGANGVPLTEGTFTPEGYVTDVATLVAGGAQLHGGHGLNGGGGGGGGAGDRNAGGGGGGGGCGGPGGQGGQPGGASIAVYVTDSMSVQIKGCRLDTNPGGNGGNGGTGAMGTAGAMGGLGLAAVSNPGAGGGVGGRGGDGGNGARGAGGPVIGVLNLHSTVSVDDSNSYGLGAPGMPGISGAGTLQQASREQIRVVMP